VDDGSADDGNAKKTADDDGEGEPRDKVEPEKVVVVPEKEEVIETRPTKADKIDYGEDIAPEDVKVIGGIVEKQLAGTKKMLQDTQDRLEVEGFVAEKPEFAKYKGTILKYLQHPAYNQIPVENIASMVAAKDLMKMGAVKEREAQARADATKGGGTTARTPGGGTTDWSKAPKGDFEAQKRIVLGQGA
jgi:hypothetical protein